MMKWDAVRLPIRGVQAAFAVVVLGLSIYVAHWSTNNKMTSPPINNYIIFASIWNFLSLIYLLVVVVFVPVEFLKQPLLLIVAETSTLVFWGSSFIGLSVAIDRYVCFGNVCNCAKAAATFGGFEAALWLVTTAYALITYIRQRRSKKTHDGAIEFANNA